MAEGRSVCLDVGERRVGVAVSDVEGRLASPLTHIDKSDPPMLIIHGEKDNVVNIRHSIKFEKSLREAGIDVELIRVPDGEHVIMLPRIYRRVAEFFDEYLGGRSVAAMDRISTSQAASQPARRQ